MSGARALESALSRPRQKWAYATGRDLAAWAAGCGFGLVRNHPYRDGNKRVGFLAIATFLGINGYDLVVSDAEVVSEIIGVAAGDVSEDDLAKWIRAQMTRL